VFYYGKKFGEVKQKINKKGQLEQDIVPISVTQAGVQANQQAEEKAEEEESPLAPRPEQGKSDSSDIVNKIVGNQDVSMDDIMNIIKGA